MSPALLDRMHCRQGAREPTLAPFPGRQVMRMNEVVASLHDVHKRYGAQHALTGVDMELHAGQVLALLGPNGAGKTTTIGLLLGLLRADAGQVRLFGRDPQQVAARRGIGVMLQDAALPPTLSLK